jgi:DNA-binding NarL/FixJ family response regulator
MMGPLIRGVAKVRGFRAVLVTVPPLLADLIRHVLTSRAALVIVAELTDPVSAYARLRALAPDVVILGPARGTPPVDAVLVRAMLPGVCVLALSADLTQLHGPGEEDIDAFTPDTLVACLSR